MENQTSFVPRHRLTLGEGVSGGITVDGDASHDGLSMPELTFQYRYRFDDDQELNASINGTAFMGTTMESKIGGEANGFLEGAAYGSFSHTYAPSSFRVSSDIRAGQVPGPLGALTSDTRVQINAAFDFNYWSCLQGRKINESSFLLEFFASGSGAYLPRQQDFEASAGGGARFGARTREDILTVEYGFQAIMGYQFAPRNQDGVVGSALVYVRPQLTVFER